nr:uncharacterized protein LOC115264439 [Aedes albopictus]
MSSVLCSACAQKIASESDRVYCFFGCDQILHARCAELNLSGATALKENSALRYICFNCRKNQLCLNTMQKKCESISTAVEELRSKQNCILDRFANFESSVADMIKNACEKAVSKCFEQLMSDRTTPVDAGRNRDSVVDLTYAEVLRTPSVLPVVRYKRKVAESSGCGNSAKKVKTSSSDACDDPDEGQWLRSGKRRMRTGQNSTSKTPVVVTPSIRSEDSSGMPNRKAKSVLKMEQTVVFKPKESQDTQTTKSVLKEKIDPVAYAVKDIFYSNNGNVAIRCDSHSSALKLLESAKKTLGGNYDIDIQKALKPRLKLVGFSADVDTESFLSKFRKQNDLPEAAIIEIVRFIKSKKDKENPMSVILELDVATFKQLLKAKSVFVGWERCLVFESIDVLRCFRCSEFGHIAATCVKPFCCPKCAECHEVSECTSEYEKCINCTIVNKEQNLPPDQQLEVNHCSWSTECPLYLKRLSRSRLRIDYFS